MGKQKEKKKRLAKKKTEQVKKGVERVASMDNVECLSKEQIKKIVANPTTTTGVSGKRKNRMLKRLRHLKKKPNSDVQMEDISVKKTKKCKSDKVSMDSESMDVD